MIIKNDIKKDPKNKTILFSPAAASFDQFKNFEHRGNYFNYLIKKNKFLWKIKIIIIILFMIGGKI